MKWTERALYYAVMLFTAVCVATVAAPQIWGGSVQVPTGGFLSLPLTGTQCLQEISGLVSGTGSACGSGGAGVSSLAATSPISVNASTGAVTISCATCVTSISAANATITIAGTSTAPTLAVNPSLSITALNLSGLTATNCVGTDGSKNLVSNTNCVQTVTAGDTTIVAGGTAANPTVKVTQAPSLTGLTLSGISGSTQCLQASTSGVISGTGTTCGSGSSGVALSATNNGFIQAGTSLNSNATNPGDLVTEESTTTGRLLFGTGTVGINYGVTTASTFTANANFNGTGFLSAGSATAATLTAGDVGASRGISSGAIFIGGSTTSVRADFGVTTAGTLTFNQPITTTGTATAATLNATGLTASKGIVCTDGSKNLTTTCSPTVPFYIERAVADPITTGTVAYAPLPTSDSLIKAVAVQYVCNVAGSGTTAYAFSYTATTTNPIAASYTAITGASDSFTTGTGDAPVTFTAVNLSGVSAAYIKLTFSSVGGVAPTGCRFYLHMTHAAQG